jgi:dihydroflavonol-4-reductase
MATVLVTGGTGFIGHHVVRLLVERGENVRVLVRPDEDRSPLADLDVEFRTGNLLDPDSLTAAVDGVDRLFHLAAIYALWLPEPEQMYRVNVEGTRALMRAAMTAGVERVVHTSSIAALGVRPGTEAADETTGFNQWRFANDYVWSKYISEQEVRGLAAAGLPVVIVNPAFPYGPGDRGPTPPGETLLNILRGRLRGYIEGGFNLVDVRDVARGHLLAMDHGRLEQGYLLANDRGNLSFREFVRIAQRIAGRTVPDRLIRNRWLAWAGKGMEMVADATGRPPMTTYKTMMYARQYLYYDPRKAVAELGLPQTPVDISIEHAVAWFRDHGYLD